MSYHGTIVPASLLFSTQSEYIKGNMELYFLHCKLIHIFLWETTITTSTGLFFFFPSRISLLTEATSLLFKIHYSFYNWKMTSVVPGHSFPG